MKKIKNSKLLVGGLVCFGLLGLSIGVFSSSNEAIQVSAGSSKSYVASSASIQKGVINSGDFSISGGVHASDSTVLFDQECSSSSKLVGKTKVKDLSKYGMSGLLNASLKLKADSFANDGSFSLSFGLPSVSSPSNQEGSTELKFTSSSSSLFLTVTEHATGSDNVLLSTQQVDSLGTASTLSFTCSTSGAISLLYGGHTYLDGSSSITSGAGYVGFFSEGINTISLSELNIYGYSYENPENVDYTEFFDNGAYNSNIFYSSSSLSGVSPSYLGVDKDAGRLDFHNTGSAQITTKYTYSNFEMDFDIPTMQREPTYDEQGNLIGLISNWFGIAWGLDDPSQSEASTVRNTKWIQYEGIPGDFDHSVKNDNPRIILYDNFNPLSVQSMSFNIFDNDVVKDKTVQIKLSIVDGVLKLFNKLADDTSYGAPVLSYDMGETPDGYLRIFTWSSGSIDSRGFKYSSIANFTIDNLHVRNLDSDAAKKTITNPGYTANGVALGSDFDYTTTPDPNDLTAALISNGNTGASKNGLAIAISALVLALGGIIKHE